MGATTKIKYDRETGEYRVRLFIDGEYQAGADYFTDDKEDARITAESMRKNAAHTDKTSSEAVSEQVDFIEDTKSPLESLEALDPDDGTWIVKYFLPLKQEYRFLPFELEENAQAFCNGLRHTIDPLAECFMFESDPLAD